jgi:hypothetical protein
VKSALGVGQLALQYGAIWKCGNLKNYFGWKLEYLPRPQEWCTSFQNISYGADNIFRELDLFHHPKPIFRFNLMTKSG